MVRQRVRIRFSKSGSLKYIGHNDLLRAFESLFRRARVPLAMSGGYHPKIKMSFPSALALGIEGFDEVLELEMNDSVQSIDAGALLADLNRYSINGLVFLTAIPLEEGTKKARLSSSVYEMEVPETLRETCSQKIALLREQDSSFAEKSNGKMVDVIQSIAQLDFSTETGLLTLELLSQDGPEAGVREVLQVLGLQHELFNHIFPRRVRCRLTECNSHERRASERGPIEAV